MTAIQEWQYEIAEMNHQRLFILRTPDGQSNYSVQVRNNPHSQGGGFALLRLQPQNCWIAILSTIVSVFCQLSFINAVRVCAYRFIRAKNPAKIRDSTPDVGIYLFIETWLA